METKQPSEISKHQDNDMDATNVLQDGSSTEDVLLKPQLTADSTPAADGDKQEDVLPKSADSTSLSKNQIKKLAKQQRWLEKKERNRIFLREKRKNRKDPGKLNSFRKKLKKNSMEKSKSDLRVAIDCSYDDVMSERCVMQLVQQLQHAYSANRRAEAPLQFYVTNLGAKTSARLDSLGDYKGWDVHFKTESYIDLFGKENVVYLTSESENILSELDSGKVYIIGGLVDHNHQKGLCHRLAVEKGIAHARFAINEHLDLKTRHVLAINHVFEILLRMSETKDWAKAFEQVIPKRKGGVRKTEMSADNAGTDDQLANNGKEETVKTDAGAESKT